MHYIGKVFTLQDMIGAHSLLGNSLGNTQIGFTLIPISVPHPEAFAIALADPNGIQAEMSSYVEFSSKPNQQVLSG